MRVGVLARRPASEVTAGDENSRAARLGLPERKLRIGLAVGQVSPIVKEMSTEPRALGGGEKAGGNDLVGVDVVDAQGDVARGECRDGLSHSVRGSVMRPVTAAAAAVRGL